jgi:hypothetical protein
VMLRIENTGACISPELNAVLMGSGYFQTDGESHPMGAIPAGEAVTVSGFTVQISPDCPPTYLGHLDLELSGPDSYQASTDLLFNVGPWFDDAESDQGWTLGVPGDGATTGIWERSDPVGTLYGGQQVQPEDDHTPDPGHICFVTGNGVPGGAAGDSDVDGGKTTLLSPVFNMDGATSATLTYWRWYTNNLGNNPDQDYWDVDVSSDGTNWTHLEHTTSSSNSWTQQSFNLGSYVPLTGTVRVRFVADDESPGSLVEAAVDDITVSIARPPSSGVAENGSVGASRLGLCRPNPIGSGGVLTYRLASRADVRLDLYDVAGRRVRTLFEGPGEAGEHTLGFAAVDQQGRPVASGIYFVRLTTPDLTQVRQVTILR